MQEHATACAHQWRAVSQKALPETLPVTLPETLPKTWRRTVIAASLLTVIMPVAAQAQDPSSFFHDRTIRIVIGHASAGDYDQGTRLLARHLPKYLPGAPAFAVQNMPGAASVVAANFLFEAAPRDGSVIGSFSRNLPVAKIRGMRNLKAQMSAFNWLGAYSKPGRLCLAAARSQVRSIADLRQTELTVGGTGAGSMVTIIPHVLRNLMGLRFKLVEGYKGLADITLAVERGELDGMCIPADFVTTTHPGLLREGKLRVLFSTEETPLRDYPDAPTIYDQARDDAEKQLMRLMFSGAEFGRPYVYPPGVPAPLVAAMRKAFAGVANDAAMKAEADKTGLDVSFTPHDELEKSLAALAKTPREILERADKLMPVK